MDLVCYRFGSFELQPAERRLLRASVPVAVGPRALRVLVVLVERAGRLISKDALLAAVWPRVVVEENALQAQVSALRKILGSGAITTVSRGGYRFELPVDRVEPESAAPKNNLPRPITAFIGRETEMLEVERLLETSRVLTLTGAGGCGKTRLAQEVAAGLLKGFPDGAWFVELAATGDPRLVPQATARVLDLRERQGATLTQVLCDHLAPAHALLVLDNAEHLLEACALLVEELLRACPHVRVLVTSRERLNIEGEVTYRVPSLSVPDRVKSDLILGELLLNESVRLFVDRAVATRPHFRVTEENAPVLVSVCRHLDGIPLAIELAAPRLRALSLEELDRRLEHCLSLLTSGSRSAAPRHRTLRALLDWSYDLLSATEQALLQRLSCFAGGCTLEAAEHVCPGDAIEASEVLDLVTSLVDKSFVTADEIVGETRYGLLEPVRQYASERAVEVDAGPRWRARHLNFYLEIAKQARASEANADYAKWLGRLDVEHDNLRAALAWSASPGADVSRGLQLGTALSRFWRLRGQPGAGSKVLLALLAVAPATLDPAVRLSALNYAGFLLTMATDFATARTLLDSALNLGRAMGNTREYAQVLIHFGIFHSLQGEYAAARRHEEEAVGILRTLGDRRALGAALHNLAGALKFMGEANDSLRLQEESLAIKQELGDSLAVASGLHLKSLLLRELGDRASARKASEQSLAIYREFKAVPGTCSLLGHLGLLCCDEGDYVAALRYLKEATRLLAEVGDRTQVMSKLELTGYACMSEDPLRAAHLWGAGERLREEAGTCRDPATNPLFRRLEAEARAAVADDAAFDAAWRSGRQLGFEAAVKYALEAELTASSPR